VGARRFLNFVITTLAANSYATFSWGPFTGPHRIVSVRFDSGIGFSLGQSAGVFTSNDPASPTGAGPFTTPNGWTGLGEAAAGIAIDVDGTAALHTPFLTSNNVPGGYFALGLDVEGASFYVKAVIDNRAGASHTYGGSIVVEKLDTLEPSATVAPRPQPTGTNVPAPVVASPSGQPGASPAPLAAPTVAPTPTPPVLVAPGTTGGLPVEMMPDFAITPDDPDESARQATS
jgi:hypothetical protein